MSYFEDQLWSELVLAHSAMTAEPLSATQQRRARRAPFAAVGAVALVGAAVAAILSISAGPSAPAAFGITQQANGAVTLTLNEILGVTAANQELAALGIRARLAKVEAGCRATGELITPTSYGHQRQEEMVETQRSNGTGLNGLVWTIRPSAIPQGDTLLITAEVISGSPLPALASTVSLYRGTAPSCQSPGETYKG
jgi:hypothetical protein